MTSAAVARKRLAEVGGAAPHEARHVAAAVLLGVRVVEASAIPQIDGDELLSLGHVELGPERWTYEDVYNRALVTLVGELGDRDYWPPPHPSHPSIRGKTPARLGTTATGSGRRSRRSAWTRSNTTCSYMRPAAWLSAATSAGSRSRCRTCSRRATRSRPNCSSGRTRSRGGRPKTAAASTKTGGDPSWFAAAADVRGSDSDRIAAGAFDGTIERWRESGEQMPLQWRVTPSFAYPVGKVDPATLRDEDGFGPRFEGSIDLEAKHPAEARRAWTAVKGNAVALEVEYMVLAADAYDQPRTLEQLDITGFTLAPTSEANKLIRQADPADLRELRRESDRVRIEIALAGIDRTPRAEPEPEVTAAPTVAELRRQAAECGIRLPPTHSERIRLQYRDRASRW